MRTAPLVVVLAIAAACGGGSRVGSGAGTPDTPGGSSPPPAGDTQPPAATPATPPSSSQPTPPSPPPASPPPPPPCPSDATASAPAPLDLGALEAARSTAAAPTTSSAASCAGIDPPGDVPMRQYSKPPLGGSCGSSTCMAGAGDATGMLAFPQTYGGASCHVSGIDFVATSGTFLHATMGSTIRQEFFLDLYLRTFQQPSGLLAAARPYLGPDPLPVVLTTWDMSAHFTAGDVWYQAAGRDAWASNTYGPDQQYFEASATHPQGGAVVAGDLRVAADAPFQHAAMMIATRDGTITFRWGPVPLASDGLVLGVGVDVRGRSLVLTDGASRFGAGHVAAQWFDVDGTPLTCPFALLAHFAASGTSPSDRAWLEAFPLVGGGLAVRRIDLSFNTSYRATFTRRYVAVVESGAARFSAPPAWMAALGGATLQVVRGGRAYAALPEGSSATPCTQRVEVLAPDGTSCGGRDYSIADGTCDALPLTVAADGTLIQQLPTSLEPTVEDSLGGFDHSCTWRWWAGALR